VLLQLLDLVHGFVSPGIRASVQEQLAELLPIHQAKLNIAIIQPEFCAPSYVCCFPSQFLVIANAD
jgi:hypothetical protein